MNEELDGLTAHQLLAAFLHRPEGRYIGVRGGARAEWLTAEQEVEDDLRALASGERDAPAPAVPEGALDVPKPEIREALLTTLEDELDALDEVEVLARAAQTRAIPLLHGRPDLAGLRELVAAWAYALSYEDTSGNDGAVPYQAAELVALHQRHRDARPDEGADDDYAARLRARGDAPARRYGVGQTYAVGDWIAHPKFGEGVVLAAHAKIDVRFRDRVRTLVHAPVAADAAVAEASAD